ncbi:hypothetical protein [Bradyrhizobium japonicum]|uniref:hypothetical protein n=1 Tax=Bradyrhizobium japonicum TaxID=375 RepID=UPI0012FD59A0|nr:hypothetical protein [Bradyrhizobium japonicum]
MGKAAGCEIVCTGEIADVRLSPKARAEYDALMSRADNVSRAQARQLQRYMQRFCGSEPHKMIEEHYRHEGSHPCGRSGGKKVAVWAFKPDGWRLYGAVLKVGNKKCFVGVDVDPAKKKQKVDQARLRSVALMIGEFDEWI